jgi:hypothetical protein
MEIWWVTKKKRWGKKEKIIRRSEEIWRGMHAKSIRRWKKK